MASKLDKLMVHSLSLVECPRTVFKVYVWERERGKICVAIASWSGELHILWDVWLLARRWNNINDLWAITLERMKNRTDSSVEKITSTHSSLSSYLSRSAAYLSPCLYHSFSPSLSLSLSFTLISLSLIPYFLVPLFLPPSLQFIFLYLAIFSLTSEVFLGSPPSPPRDSTL